jgi:hypothetical protein
MKLRRSMRNVRLRAEIAQPMMDPWGHGRRAVLDGSALVRTEKADATVVTSRENPRSFFPGGRRRFRWDELDLAYFAGYAAWNYVTFPALLLRNDVAWTQLSETTLEATFQPTVPTHSPVQRFHFDRETALLRQHDYTAEVFGDWAAAANAVLEHGTWEGIPYPSKRRVTPRRPDGTPRPLPLLVGIDVRDWRLA